MSRQRHPLSVDYRLVEAYEEATQLDEKGVAALCPSYLELSEVDMRYRDETIIGQGATKMISKIYDSRSKRWVAMARPRQDLPMDSYDDFVREAWLTSSLSHPNIIKIYDVGIDAAGAPFFTMDLKSGSILCGSRKNGDLHELLGAYVKVCEAVAYAHSRGVVHLDLKPANIQVDRFGEVLVCDWELGACLRGREGADVSSDGGNVVSAMGILRGTPGFMAPEQATEGGTVDERTDIYALGCILYVILTGQNTLMGSTAKELLEETRRAAIVPPSQRLPSRAIPQSLEAVVLKATARDPKERYASVGALRYDIVKYLSGYATAAENSGLVKGALLFAKRNRALTGAYGLGLVFLMAIVLFLLKIGREKDLSRQVSERAEGLETKRNSLEQETNELEGRLQETQSVKAAVAHEIASSCRELYLLSFRKDPVGTYAAMENLARQALALDPNCVLAQRELFKLKCVSMDFRGALKLLEEFELLRQDPRGEGWNSIEDYMVLAEEFRRYEFDVDDRPSSRQLLTVVERGAEMMKIKVWAFGDMVAYDFETREDRKVYSQVVDVLARFLNPKAGSSELRYDPERSHLEMTLSHPHMTFRYPGGKNRSILRFLEPKSVKVICKVPFGLVNLNYLKIEELDLREAAATLKTGVHLPNLKVLHIRGGQFGSQLIDRAILTEEALRVVEH